VEADDGRGAAGLQQVREHAEEMLKVREFAVHEDSQGLEDSRERCELLPTLGRRARRAVDPHRRRPLDQFAKLPRRGDRLSSPGFDNRRGNGPGLRLIAEIAEAGFEFLH
jgi:hypothetical protein